MRKIPARRSTQLLSAGHGTRFVVLLLSAAWTSAQTTFNIDTTISGPEVHSDFTITDSATVGVYGNSDTGGSLDASGHSAYIGGDSSSAGTGTLVTSSYGSVTNHDGYLGYLLYSVGTANIAGQWTNTGDLTVGKSGEGTVTLLGTGSGIAGTKGVLNVGNGGGTITLAEQSGSEGTLNIGAAVNGTATTGGVVHAATVEGGAGTATLQFNTTGTLYFTQDGTASGTGVNTSDGLNLINTAGTTVVTGGLDHTGGTTINGGTLQIGNGGTTGSISGNITNNAALVFDHSDASPYAGNLSGSGSLTKSGASTLSFSGDITHTGGTTINGGILQIGAGGTTGSISGNITNNAALTFNRSDASTYAGVISGSGSLTKSGSGTLTLSGDNTYAGGTTLSAGTLALDSSGALGSTGTLTFKGGTLQFGENNTTDYSNRFSTATNQQFSIDTHGQDVTFESSLTSSDGSLTKSGAGTLTLSGDNTYTGGTTLSAGTLALGSSGALGSTGTINFNGGTLQFGENNTTDYSSRFSTAFYQQFKVDTHEQDLTFASSLANYGGNLTKFGTGTLTLTGSNTYSGGTLISDGTLQIGNGGTTGSVSGNIDNNASLVFDRSDSSTYSGNISGTGSLTKSGTGTLTLIGSNTYTGGTTISGGTLEIGKLEYGSISGDIVNNAALQFSHTYDFTYDGNISGTGSLNIVGGITDVSTGSTGGVLTLSGDNTYTGGTTLTLGTVELGSSGALGSTGTITFAGGAMRFTAGNTTDYSNRFSTSVSQGIIIDTNGQDVTFASPLATAGGSLIKIGAGTLTLTGTNTYAGVSPSIAAPASTFIRNGTLQIGDGGTTGSVTGNIFTYKDGSLVFNPSDDLTYAGSIQGFGTLTKSGAGTLTLTGNNKYDGGTLISDGTLQIGNGGTTGSIGDRYGLSISGNITNNAKLVFDRSDTLAYFAKITGTGTTTIADGILRFGPFASVAGNTVTVNSGAGIGGTGILGNGLDLQAGSSLNFNLTAGGHGLRITGGDFDIGSGITINFTDGGGFGNDTYDLIDGTGSNITNHDVGSFTLGTTVSGFNYSLAWLDNILQLTATGGTDPDYTAVPSAVPEPSTYAAVLGALALGLVTRRRRPGHRG